MTYQQGRIPKEKWPEYLNKLRGFWETKLFTRVKVDANLGHTIEQDHFGKCLYLWFETINELFERKLAIKAKESALKLATEQIRKTQNSRPTKSPILR